MESLRPARWSRFTSQSSRLLWQECKVQEALAQLQTIILTDSHGNEIIHSEGNNGKYDCISFKFCVPPRHQIKFTSHQIVLSMNSSCVLLFFLCPIFLCLTHLQDISKQFKKCLLERLKSTPSISFFITRSAYWKHNSRKKIAVPEEHGDKYAAAYKDKCAAGSIFLTYGAA